MTGILALYGSGEFTSAMIDVDTALLDLTKAPAVCILPTAAGLEDTHRRWIDDGIRYYQSLGVEVSGLDIVNGKDANSKNLAKELEKYTYFVFSGGDPGHLLDTLQNSLVWGKIRELFELGATIVGSSAGAMVMGSMVFARVYDMEKKGIIRPWEPGLGLADFGVLPHFNVFQSYTPEEKKLIFGNIPRGLRVVGIEENTAYYRYKDTWTKKGRGKVHERVEELYA